MSGNHPLEHYLNSLPEWKDNQRCLSLFSPFRGDRSDAPEAWDAKMAFWKKLILHSVPLGWLGEHYPQHSDRMMSFSPSIMATRFSRLGASPLGLHVVIKEMIHDKELVPESHFWSVRTNTGVIIRGLRDSLAWLFEALNRSIFDENSSDNYDDASHIALPREQLIVIPILKRLSSLILSFINSNYHDFVDNCFTWEEWKLVVQKIATDQSWSTPSESDNLILLRYITMTNSKVIVSNFSSAVPPLFVYISSNESKRSENLTPLLSNVSQVKQVISKLESQLSMIDDQVKQLDKKVRYYLNESKNRNMALKVLRRKHDLALYQEKQATSLQNLSEVMMSIRSAKDQQHVLEAYKLGSSALETILHQKELSLESIDNVTESLSNAMEESRNIDAAMKSIIPPHEYEQEELEKELEELVQEEASVQEILAGLQALKVPQEEPKVLKPERKMESQLE